MATLWQQAAKKVATNLDLVMSDEPPFEYRKWVYEQKRRDAERIHDRGDAIVDAINGATIASGHAALRATLLINGGGAVAMLAFIGSLASTLGTGELTELAGSLIWFAWGVAAAVVGMAFTYFANASATETHDSRDKIWEHPYFEDGAKTKRWLWVTRVCQIVAIAAGAISIGLFIAGMLDVEASVGQLNPAQN